MSKEQCGGWDNCAGDACTLTEEERTALEEIDAEGKRTYILPCTNIFPKCKKHGHYFMVSAADHLAGWGCPECEAEGNGVAHTESVYKHDSENPQAAWSWTVVSGIDE